MNTQEINTSLADQATVNIYRRTVRTFAEMEAHPAFSEGFIQLQKPRSHYKFLMDLGRVIPSDKAQAKYYLSSGRCIGLIQGADARYIHELMQEQGMEALFVFTKNKRFMRLVNNEDFCKALKLKYSI
jgi:hypothetical protein